MPTQMAKRMKAEPRDGDLAASGAAGGGKGSSSPPSQVEAAAKTPITKLATHRKGAEIGVPGLYATDHHLSVPLDYADPSKGRIDLFAREVVAPARAKDTSLPYLLYLQGGPGFESPRPCEASSWIKAAVGHFRVILMDQRGTGLSSPITPAVLARKGAPEDQVEYLAHFFADSIVADAEVLRRVLTPPTKDYGGRWSVLGQSFGGFCAVTYLSMAPEGLYEVMLTGGLPPCVTLPCAADTAYRSLYRRVLAQNSKYYSRFPGDVQLAGRIVRALAAHPGGGPVSPCGNRVTARAFQMLGLNGLGSGGGFERLHFLLERAFDGRPEGQLQGGAADGADVKQEGTAEEISVAFMKGFDAWMSWDTNPLYALLHEQIYCQQSMHGGGMPAATSSRWAAQRVMDEQFADEFDAEAAAKAGRPIMFTGEMVYPCMFEDFASLRPLRDAASLLAERSRWPTLYDTEALGRNMVPVASATYVEDMYVDFELAQGTARAIRGIRQWMTNEYMHSGVRDDGARIFEQLLGMTRGSIPLY